MRFLHAGPAAVAVGAGAGGAGRGRRRGRHRGRGGAPGADAPGGAGPTTAPVGRGRSSTTARGARRRCGGRPGVAQRSACTTGSPARPRCARPRAITTQGWCVTGLQSGQGRGDGYRRRGRCRPSGRRAAGAGGRDPSVGGSAAAHRRLPGEVFSVLRGPSGGARRPISRARCSASGRWHPDLRADLERGLGVLRVPRVDRLQAVAEVVRDAEQVVA